MPTIDIVRFRNPQEVNNYFDEMASGTPQLQKLPGVDLPDFVASLRSFTLAAQELGVKGFALVAASRRGYPSVMRIEVMAPLHYRDHQTMRIVRGVAEARDVISRTTWPTFDTVHSFVNTGVQDIDAVVSTRRLSWRKERARPIGIFGFRSA